MLEPIDCSGSEMCSNREIFKLQEDRAKQEAEKKQMDTEKLAMVER